MVNGRLGGRGCSIAGMINWQFVIQKSPHSEENGLWSSGGQFFPAARLPPLDEDRQHRDEDNGDDDELEVFLHKGDVAEEETREGEQKHPNDPTDEVVRDKVAIRHASDARHEGREGADDGHETGEEDGLAAVLLEEGVGFIEVFLLDPLDIIGAVTEVMTDPIVNGIAEDGGQHEQTQQQPDVERAEGGEGACREQERVAWQEGCDHEARLHEDDEEQQAIRPRAVLGDDPGQIYIEVQEQVNQKFYSFHTLLSNWDAGGHYNQFSVISVRYSV
jgi:hypothetical protein